jgi:hypothetical protein
MSLRAAAWSEVRLGSMKCDKTMANSVCSKTIETVISNACERSFIQCLMTHQISPFSRINIKKGFRTDTKYIKMFFVLGLSVCAMMLYSCNNETAPTPPASADVPFFHASVIAGESYWDWNNDTDIVAPNIRVEGFCYSNPIISNLTMKINSKSPVISRTAFDIEQFRLTSEMVLLNEPVSGLKQIQFITGKGVASATFTIPGPIKITSHQPIDTIASDTNPVITWQGTADWFFCFFTLIDSVGNYLAMIDSAVLGVGMTISISQPQIAQVRFGIIGINGPYPASGAVSNISGDGQGFVIASNDFDPFSGVRLYLRGRGNIKLAKNTVLEHHTGKDVLDFFYNRVLNNKGHVNPKRDL